MNAIWLINTVISVCFYWQLSPDPSRLHLSIIHQLHNCLFISSSGRMAVPGHPSARPDWKAFRTIRIGNARAYASLVAPSRRCHSGVCHLFNAISKTLQRDIKPGVCAWAACRSSGGVLAQISPSLTASYVHLWADWYQRHSWKRQFPLFFASLLFNSWQDKITAPASTIIFYSDEE